MAGLEDYTDREQAWVKHWLLRRYLERLIMKVGTRWSRFVYVDGFAGPWGARTENLSDTSFGIAIDVMRDCQAKLAEHGYEVPMRAAFFEKYRRPAVRLKQYAEEQTTPMLSIEAYHANFMDQIDAITSQLCDNDFAFVLLDPKGYKEIPPAKLAPLLRRRGVEVMINVMWDFMNRFWDTDQAPVLDEIFGEDRRERCDRDDLEGSANRLYAERLRMVADSKGGRLYASSFPVQHPTKARTHYFLVYATHAAQGLITFGEVAEATWREQELTKAKTTVRLQSGGLDLFAGEVHDVKSARRVNTWRIREAWLQLLPVSGSEIAVSHDVMAQLIERCSCFVSDAQAEALALIREGVLLNMSVGAASMKRRTKNAVDLKKVETLRRA